MFATLFLKKSGFFVFRFYCSILVLSKIITSYKFTQVVQKVYSNFHRPYSVSCWTRHCACFTFSPFLPSHQQGLCSINGEPKLISSLSTHLSLLCWMINFPVPAIKILRYNFALFAFPATKPKLASFATCRETELCEGTYCSSQSIWCFGREARLVRWNDSGSRGSVSHLD